jgi:cysteine desulfurase
MFLKREIYLDNNATTKPRRSVVRVMKKVSDKIFGNPSSLYQTGYVSKEIIEESRQIIASAVNAMPEEILFTGSASESNNQVLVSLFEKFSPVKKTILSTLIEHPSVLQTLQYLATRGAVVKYIPVDEKGVVEIAALHSMIDDDTFLVCVMYANNEIGILQDVPAIAKIVHEKKALFFSDCVQALGKTAVDVKNLEVDYASFSAHKIHGPKGIGVLYVAKGAPIAPFVHGGHQETGLRAGTESIHNIAGFAEAVKSLPRIKNKRSKILALRNHFADGLQKLAMNISINTKLEKSIPNTLNVTFNGISNTQIIALFDYYRICVSAGSACSTPENKPSHVLTAIGLSDEKARESIRFSLSENTRRKDIQYVVSLLKKMRDGKTPVLSMLAPSFLNESELFNDENYILDVRFWYDKLKLKSLPGSHEASLFRFGRYLRHIPKEKNIIVVCQGGVYSPIVVFYLKKKGYTRACFLMGGMEGWKSAYPELYAEYAGKNIVKLER